jgi:hypothetical protein
MRRQHVLVVASVVVFAFTGASAARAQSTADPSGHWKGALEIPGQSLPVEFDVAKDTTGRFVGTFTGSGVTGLPLTKVSVSGRLVTLQATSEQPFSGELSDDGKTIAGMVIVSGYSLPLALTRTGDAHIEPPPTSPAVSRDLEGAWEGTLQANKGPLRLVLTMSNQPDGRATAQIVSVDEGGLLIPVVITQNGSQISYASAALPSTWAGVLSADGRELAGTFTQGPASLPLTFRRAGSAK